MLILGTFFINFFVWVMFGYSLYNSRKHYDKLAEVTTQNMAKILEASINGIFDKIDIGVLSAVHETERQLASGGINKKNLNDYIHQQFKQLPEIEGLRITDAEGNLRYGTDIPADTLVNINDREYFKNLRDNPNEGLAFSPLIRGRISGRWNITIARRINKPDGTFAGIALGIFMVDYCDRLFSQLEVGKCGALGIRDLKFNLVALYPKGKEPGSQIGSNIISQKTRDMITANPVTATYKTVFARDGKERMVTFRKMARYPLYLFATLAPSDYMVSWRKEAGLALALLVTFMLATITAAWMMYKSRLESFLHAEAKQYGEEMKKQNDELNNALASIKKLNEERNKAEEDLRESEERFRNILENAPTGIAVLSLEGKFMLVNRALAEIVGYDKEELEKLTFQEITYPDDLDADLANVQQLLDGTATSYQMEKRYIRKDRQIVWIQLTGSVRKDDNGTPLYFIAQIEDISVRKRNEEQIHQLAYYDSLTELPNRTLMKDRLNLALIQSKRFNRSLALMFIDLDNFKQVNDTLGHDAGDELLKVMADRLLRCVRGADTVCRFGGDEYVIILEEIAHPHDAEIVAGKMLNAINEPLYIHDNKLQITASIGIAVYSNNENNDAKTLMKKADIAMYEAKKIGRNGFFMSLN